MFFYFKVTTIWNGKTTALHMSQKPLSEPKKGTGQYLEIEAKTKGWAVRRLKAGPKNNDIWKFVTF